MKTILKNAVAVAILFSTTMGMANGLVKDFSKKVNAKNEVEKRIITLKEDPTFKRKGRKVFVNLLNLSEGKVILKVVDSEGRAIYKEEIDGDLIVQKAFNFSKAYSDKYTLIVVDKYGTYQRKIEVK